MYAINIGVYKAEEAHDEGAGRPSKNKNIIFGELIMRYMFFGVSKSEATKRYLSFVKFDKFLKSVVKSKNKGYLYRAYWTEQNQYTKV
mgnify:CR=1 FL=1